ncbi:MAG: response regulator transcription factor [Bacteroidales bacterium]|nr:response regulator transcription factor [Bacteroidales bacterium]
MKKPKILYVEDDQHLGFVTKDTLEHKGFSVTYCRTGKEALQQYRSHPFDLCILDVMLPEMDGLTLAGKIRESNLHIPILFLSARSMKEDRITGLAIGGDDYITKPFSMDELILKIEVFIRRSRIHIEEGHMERKKIGSFSFDVESMVLYHENRTIQLTATESSLLAFLSAHSSRMVRREEILKAVWGKNSYLNSRSLDVFISRLRKHLAADPSIQIRTIHGMGFLFDAK